MKVTNLFVITKETIAELRAHQKRTGVNEHKLLKHGKNKPDGLTPVIIRSWTRETIKIAEAEHVNYVLDRWAALPDKESDYIALTSAIIDELHFHKERTLINIPMALHEADAIKPKGLSASLVKKWLDREVCHAKKEHLIFVLDQWQKQPSRKDDHARLTPLLVDFIQMEQSRTGVAIEALLENRDDKPEDLTPAKFNKWKNQKNLYFPKNHIEYVLNLWASIPDKAATYQRQSVSTETRKRIMVITPGMLAEIAATNIQIGNDAPQGLHKRIVSMWMAEKIKTGRIDHIEYMLGLEQNGNVF
ncbi:MAG: hypothetical protein JKY34_02470 [Kordiimonadaceae bacterium]|nr:hypothetical protein [Kordiimonadaceae bacterium]